MIAHVYKPKRKKDGKVVVFRNYRARYRLEGDYYVTDIALRTSDKQVAEKKLREIVSEKEKERAGAISPRIQRDAAMVDLKDHLEEFLKHLIVLGRSEEYIKKVSLRVKKLIHENNWKLVKDISPKSFCDWRVQQSGKSPKTLNEYLNAMNTFLNWMFRQECIACNPLATVERVSVQEKQQRRRAFTEDELNRLLTVSTRPESIIPTTDLFRQK